MSYAVRAWKDATGAAGITIGVVTAAGYDNHVAEIDLNETDVAIFMSRCASAIRRARAADGVLQEPMPGAYQTWEGAEDYPSSAAPESRAGTGSDQ